LQDALSGILDLARDAPEPLHRQMATQIKSAIVNGRLPAQTGLPSSRVLAARLGVSRNTVLAAIEQLKAEGVLESEPGSGVRVADFGPPDLERADPAPARARRHRLAPRWDEPLARFHPSPLDRPRPFLPGIPDLAAFPAELWATSLRRAARLADTATAGYAEMSGHPRFRRALARHLAETRGVVAEPEQIIVTSSARGGLSLIASALLTPGEDAAIEEPGFRSAKAIFSAAGARLAPVPVDAQGIDPSRLPAGVKPRLIYTTPSHQYPTGALMALSRRLALIELALHCGGYIVEDDYDSEFQYRGRPIAALQGLDRAGCVLYLGTFAKSLLPALRAGFVVAPPGLAEELTRVHRHTGQFVPPVIQLALADFIERGHYRAHVRRMRTVYARRLAEFADGIAEHSRGALIAAIPDGGLQTVVRSGEGLSEKRLAARLDKAGVAGQPLADFHLEPGKARHEGLLMGFAAWDGRQAGDAFRRLARF
jgi:GntR family transcriptional regulator/MocR family aminotransferase